MEKQFRVKLDIQANDTQVNWAKTKTDFAYKEELWIMTANEFVKQYKIGEIVYPSAVAINCDTTMKKAYQELETFVGQDIKRIYEVRCPKCGCYERYYSLSDITKHFWCVNCDVEFVVDHENDVIVLYEKI